MEDLFRHGVEINVLFAGEKEKSEFEPVDMAAKASDFPESLSRPC